jgi:hypothetical protein
MLILIEWNNPFAGYLKGKEKSCISCKWKSDCRNKISQFSVILLVDKTCPCEKVTYEL